ncbi:unnamed protein product [Durusdinium trenchii]|uniref:Uncharacterized protein n=1 Tax=Durusdinium trenchii TaxID=1381693 RepID=A0ABP0JIQ4_9DINO
MMRPYRPDAWHFMPSSLFGESLDHGPCAPAMALKFFRGGQAPSGNLLLVGQPSSIEKDGVGQCLCSQSAQVGCDGADSNPLLSRHSVWPHATGLSAFAALGQDGRETRGGLNGEVVECPWALILQPVGHMPEAPKPRSSRSGPAPPLQQMLQTPPGTVLYEVYACPSPGAAFESGWLQLIGRIISASKFILEPISENLHQLRFRHQKKEEDYVLRPEWLQELNPSHSACGSEHFTRLLERQQRTFDGQGGAFVADALPSSRWVWSAGMKAQQGLSSFPRSISTSATAESWMSSPASTRSTSRDSLAAALRQRGGRCSPSPQAAVKEASPKEVKASGASSGWPTNMVLALLFFVLAPWLQPEAASSDGSLRTYALAILLAVFLGYRSCSKRKRDEEDEDDQWEDCFQDTPAHESSRRSEPWRQEFTREPVLVRGVSAHELLLN